MLSEKIVVVDDDVRVLKSLKIGLLEYAITFFTNGKEALEFLSKPNLISLVLLDVRMPGIDGLSVLEAVRKINKDVIIVLMSAYGTKDVVIQALRNRADDFIEKPFKIPELKSKIQTLLSEKLGSAYLNVNKEDRVARIKRFVERNYKEVNLESVAKELYLSPKYISRMFKHENHSSFRDFKIRVKMQRAKELLSSSYMNINEIAIELGYQNSESFMRLFKRMNNLTPSEYRKKHRKQRAHFT